MNRSQLLLIGSFLLLAGCAKDQGKEIPSVGLIAKISFDGSAFDEVNNISGINHAAALTADHHGIANRAMYFNSHDSSYVDFGSDRNFSFPQKVFTLSCWVFVTEASQPITILSKRTPFGPFEYSLDNHMNKSVFNFDNWISSGATTVYGTDPLAASVPITLNQWQHIAVLADGMTLKVYSNGQLMPGVDYIKSGNSFSDTDAPFQIGVGGGYGKNYFFEGAIDEVLIYDRVLSEEEIVLLSSL